MGIVLIFDECTSGFRESFGGLHKKYDVQPDIAMFGKALGNGYAINALIGRREVMENAQKTFISSTFWTERIGSAAANATLNEMEKIESWKIITNKGKKIKNSWKKISEQNQLKIDISGISALPVFNFKSSNFLKYKTFITQEMLKKKIIATNSIYVSTAHEDQLIDKYLNELNQIFKQIKKFEDGENIDNYLEGPECHSTFKRLA